MSAPTRNPNGITNVPVINPWGMYVAPAPCMSHEYFNDWDNYTAGDWTITTSTGSNSLTAGNGGLLSLVTAASNNDIQHIAKNPAAFAFASGYQFWFSTRMMLTDSTNSAAIAGVQAGGTAFAPTDGVYFSKATAGQVWTLNLTASSSTTTLTFDTTANAADSTYQVLSFYYDGRDTPTLTGWICDVSKPGIANIKSVKSTQTMTNLPTANLTQAIGVKAGAAAAKTLRSDYLFVANEVNR